MYQKIVEDGYIIAVVEGVSDGNITKDEYDEIIAKLKTRRKAKEGYGYRLKDNLRWELYELPVEDEIIVEE